MSPVFFWMVRYHFIVQNIFGKVLCGSGKHFVVFCVAVLYMILCACVFACCVFQKCVSFWCFIRLYFCGFYYQNCQM